MTPYLADPDVTLYHGDALEVLRQLPDRSVHMCATSPPFYGLRDYGVEGQIGLEATPDEWAARLVAVFSEVSRVLRDDGTLWVECGDSYVGLSQSGGCKPKDLLGQPWLLAFALRAGGWWLRQAIVWHKPNAMPESATDRCTTAHSYVFLLSKRARYWFDGDAIAEPAAWERWGDQTVPKHNGTNTAAGWIPERPKRAFRTGSGPIHSGGPMPPAQPLGDTKHPRSVWTIPTQGYPEAHFATWPEALVRRMILAGCPEGGTVLDPFGGSGTTALVARKLGRRAVLIELSEEYSGMAARRLQQLSLLAEGA